MEKEFVPYELAVKLKELGFGNSVSYLGTWMTTNGYPEFIPKGEIMCDDIIAPLWQQAFDWFREVKNNTSTISPYLNFQGEKLYCFRIYTEFDSIIVNNFKTYEEARKDCIKKLIELTK